MLNKQKGMNDPAQRCKWSGTNKKILYRRQSPSECGLIRGNPLIELEFNYSKRYQSLCIPQLRIELYRASGIPQNECIRVATVTLDSSYSQAFARCKRALYK